MAARKFKRLRNQMTNMDVDQQWLADKINRCQAYISVRMNGKQPWDLDDVYRICEALHIPPGEMATYFPKDGNDNQIALGQST